MARLLYVLISLSLFRILPSLRAELTDRQTQALEGMARDRYSTRWDLLSTNELAALRKKVELYQAELRTNHLVGGLVVSLRYTDTNRTQVTKYEATEDSGAWTGFYLAGLATRYAVERKPSILGEVREVLSGVERLLNASGRLGYLARFAAPERDPAYKATYATFGGADPQRPGFGRLAFPGTNGLVWLGGPSRDNYAGLNLGLALTHRFVRESGIRQRVSNVMDHLLTRLDTDGWRLNDGQGNVEYLDPLLSVALLRTGASTSGRSWGGRYEQQARLYANQHRTDSPRPLVPAFDDLRPALFAAADLMSLSLLETNKTRQLLYLDQLTKLWRSAGPELNPWLAVAYVGAFDLSPNDSSAQAILQGVLAQYPAPPRWAWSRAQPTNLVGGLVEANGRTWCKDALPFPRRPVSAFQWAQAGRTWMAEDLIEPVVHPGVDLITAYWLARNASFVWPEDLQPVTTKSSSRESTPKRSGASANLGTNTVPKTPAPPR